MFKGHLQKTKSFKELKKYLFKICKYYNIFNNYKLQIIFLLKKPTTNKCINNLTIQLVEKTKTTNKK